MKVGQKRVWEIKVTNGPGDKVYFDGCVPHEGRHAFIETIADGVMAKYGEVAYVQATHFLINVASAKRVY